MRKLTVIKLVVEPALRDKLAVRAGFDNMSVLHNENNIRIHNGGKAVRDDEARAPSHHLGECALNTNFGARVNRGRCLVENEHRRQAEHNARYANKLLLPLRELLAALSDEGVVAVFQPLYEAVGVCRLCRRDNLLVGGVGLAHSDIIPNRRGRQPGVLEHHSVIFA